MNLFNGREQARLDVAHLKELMIEAGPDFKEDSLCREWAEMCIDHGNHPFALLTGYHFEIKKLWDTDILPLSKKLREQL